MILAIDQFKTMGLLNQEGFTNLLSIVERALNKMKNLIEELTEAREQEHRYKSHTELLSFENILEDVRLTLSDNIQSSGARINSDIQVSEVTFSRRKLRSIIYNLLHNSIKYKSPGKKPEMLIKTFREDGYTVISVSDNGIGIEPSKQELVFSKYYRLDHSIEGSGIGLYLVKELVTSAGGKVLLESEPGTGTEIRIFIKDV